MRSPQAKLISSRNSFLIQFKLVELLYFRNFCLALTSREVFSLALGHLDNVAQVEGKHR